MASKSTIEIVKSTAPVLKEYGEQITKVFYKKLFETHPDLRKRPRPDIHLAKS